MDQCLHHPATLCILLTTQRPLAHLIPFCRCRVVLVTHSETSRLGQHFLKPFTQLTRNGFPRILSPSGYTPSSSNSYGTGTVGPQSFMHSSTVIYPSFGIGYSRSLSPLNNGFSRPSFMPSGGQSYSSSFLPSGGRSLPYLPPSGTGTGPVYPSGTGTMPFYTSGTGISLSIFPSSGLGPIVPSLTSSVPSIAPSQTCVVLPPSPTFILQVSGSDTANGMFLQIDPSDDTQFALFTDNRDDATNFEIKYATQLTVTSPQSQGDNRHPG